MLETAAARNFEDAAADTGHNSDTVVKRRVLGVESSVDMKLVVVLEDEV